MRSRFLAIGIRLERRENDRGILHHVGEQFAEQLIAQAIDLVVAPQHRLRQFLVAAHHGGPALNLRSAAGYTSGMKTAVSIPDEIFEEAERLARRTKRSRSRLFSDALKEYVASRTPERLTRRMDAALAEIGAESDLKTGDDSRPFTASAARRVLERTDW